MIWKQEWNRRLLRRAGGPCIVLMILATTACGVLDGGSWNRDDIRQSLFPSRSVVLPSSAHRVPVPADAGFISIDDAGVIRVSTGEEMPLPVSSNEEVLTFVSNWVAMRGGRSSFDPPKLCPTHAVHIVPGPDGPQVDGEVRTWEQMVAYLASRLGENPDKPVGVEPDPDCPVDAVLSVLEVLAFAEDFGLPEPRTALANPRSQRKLAAGLGIQGPGSVIGPVLEREPSTAGTVVLRVASGTPYRQVYPVIAALIEARVPTVLFETAGDGTCRTCLPQDLPGGIPLSLEPEGLRSSFEPTPAVDGKKRDYSVKQIRMRKPDAGRMPTPATVEVAVTDSTPLEPQRVREPEPALISVPTAAEPASRPDPEEVIRYVAGGAVTEPRRVSGPEPLYPEAAMRAKLTGAIILELVIRSNGEVDDIKVLKGLPLGLTEAAVEAVKQWRYEPSRLDGVAVNVLYVQTVRFTLPESQ